MIRQLALAAALTFGFAALPAPAQAQVQTVDYVDVEAYMGQWYEISSTPAFFSIGCTGTTANYTLMDDGTVEVINACNVGWLKGPERVAEGYAEVDNEDTNAELLVYFGGSTTGGEYWIVDLDEDYQWAVVGDSRASYLFVLSRTPQMDAELYEDILDRAAQQGFDVDRLEKTRQRGDRL